MDINNTQEDLVAQILKNGFCGCRHNNGKNPAEDPHTCPYAEDVNNDKTTLCMCCNECAQQCADDI